MVPVRKILKQSEPARGRVAQGHGPSKIFVLIAYMVKLSLNGGSKVFLEYPGFFDVLTAAGVKWPCNIYH